MFTACSVQEHKRILVQIDTQKHSYVLSCIKVQGVHLYCVIEFALMVMAVFGNLPIQK